MTLENYCKKCGHRILPNNTYCPGCGRKTGYAGNKDSYVFTYPIYDIGFFNLSIDFSPYIISKRTDFKYDICHCGYLNDINNEFCYMCGAKRSYGKLAKILKIKSKPKFDLNNILCECGAVNSSENVFCEMCGKQLLKVEQPHINTNYSNFNFEFDNSIFCSCGEENEQSNQFCNKCGLPLKSYGNLSDMALLCVCSTLNEINASFCIECGANLKRETSRIVCVCGHQNPVSSKICSNCERPLNPKKIVKSKIVCSCGTILPWGREFCPNCGENIKRRMMLRNTLSKKTRPLRRIFRK